MRRWLMVVLGAAVLMCGAMGSLASAEGQRGVTIKGLESRSGVKVGQFRALVIGIDDYQDPKIPDLKTAAADAEAVAKLLEGRYGFSDVTLLLNRKADNSAIQKQLRRLATASAPDDSVLIYYAGHGDLDRITGSGWWIPANATAQDPSTYLDNAVIRNYIKAIPARHVLLVSDSCFSGTLFGATRAMPSVIDDQYYAGLFKERSRWGMTSGNLTPVSDSGSAGHSTFAYQFLKALKDNRQPFLTPREIYQQIAPIISNNSSQMPMTKPIRNADDQGGEFVFIQAGAEAAPTKPKGESSSDATALEIEFWNSIKNSDDPAQFRAYLNRFPNGTFAELARLKLQTQPPSAKQLPVHKVRAAGVEFETVALPGGHFAMGSSRGNDSERPVHQVRLAPFEMMTTEVTVGQFRAFVQQSGYRTEAERSGGCDRADFRTGQWSRIADANWMNPGFEQGEDSPVVCVSWNDADVFAQWLSKTTGDHFQLPTEAQWEYAARAGTTTAYSFGDDAAQLCRYGNGADQSTAREYPGWIAADCDDGFSTRTAPVGHFQANGFGLFDMHGNVFEWCRDRAHPNYQGAPGDGSDWEAGGMPPRILRGGGWYNAPVDLRSSFRHWSDPSNRSFNTGFRLVREAVQAARPQPAQAGLTIQVTPSDARIRILNIGPKYRPGMELEPGRYHIEISRSGYLPHLEWLEVGGRDLVHRVKMLPLPETVKIPGGAFQMGSGLRADGRRDVQTLPVHQVRLAPFRMMKTEVTQRMWSEVMGDNPSKLKHPENPVEMVSWEDAQSFIRTLNRLTGLKYRLPSEAQWEYAARAGTTTRWSWGDDNAPEVAGQYGWFAFNAAGQHPYPVGQKSPNPWGLYDMLGNVWEWVQDCVHYDYRGAPSDGSAWMTGDCRSHPQRGGSAGNQLVATSLRVLTSSNSRIRNLGFRLVLEP